MYVWGILVLMLAGETGWGACMKKRAVGMIRSFGVGERRDVQVVVMIYTITLVSRAER